MVTGRFDCNVLATREGGDIVGFEVGSTYSPFTYSPYLERTVERGDPKHTVHTVTHQLKLGDAMHQDPRE